MNKFLMSAFVIVINPIVFIISVFVFYYLYLKSMPGITTDNDVILAHVSQIAGTKSSGALLATIVLPIIFLFKRKWKLPFVEMVKWYSVPFFGVSILWVSVFSNDISAITYQTDKTSQAYTEPTRADREKSDSVLVEIRKIPELDYWRQYDKEKFEYAVSVDEELKQDIYWQDRSLEERFREVTRRTMKHFNM